MDKKILTVFGSNLLFFQTSVKLLYNYYISDSDDESDSEDDSDDDEPLIKPIDRQLRTARPIRIQLLKRLTLLQAIETDLTCCVDDCAGFWIWLTSRDVYRDFA